MNCAPAYLDSFSEACWPPPVWAISPLPGITSRDPHVPGMNGDATLLSDVLCSYLIDPHGSGSSTPPARPDGYGGDAEALLARHASSPWYAEARPVMDSWTERLLAATDVAEMEQMMATVLPFYLAEPDMPEVAARLAEMSRVMKADLAAGKAWEGGLYQSVDLRPLLGRITSPTLVVAGELDFICGPAQAQPIAGAITGSQLVILASCGHIPSIEAPQEYRQAVINFLRR